MTGGILLRALMVAGVIRVEIPDTLITAAALAYVGFYPVDWLYLSRDFIQATVHLVCFLAVAKLLTAKTNRDYSYVKIIAFLELLAAAILSANVNFFFFLALFLGFGVAAFACSEIRRSSMGQAQVVRGALRLFHWRLTALTVWMALGILFMTAGMFFLLPRTARAAFQHLSQRYHLSGFSNEVTLGQIGEIQKQSTTVMHVRFDTGKPPANMKWRGASLSEFDGRRWFNRPARCEELQVERGMIQLVPTEQILRLGRRFSYVVYAKALATDALFVAGTPEYLYTNSPSVIRGFGGTLRAGFGPSDTRRYAVYSFMEDARSAPPPLVFLTPDERQTYLRLPVIDARIARLAADLASQERNAADRARAIETYLRRSFGYTTELLETPVPDPLAHFLFERRKGHCEYFASSMAVMLRTLGIPSRVITGFQSGVYNPVSGWQMIRASDAHSWVEAYLPDAGWTVFDPTPPDATLRVASIWTRALFYADAMEVFWQDWVLNYDLDRQVTLAARMEQSSRMFSLDEVNRLMKALADWRKRAADAAIQSGIPILGTACVLTLLAFIRKPALRSWRTRRRVKKLRRGEVAAGDATLLYLRMLSILRRRGIEKPAWLTPVEFVRVLPTDTALLVEDLTLAYNDLRFGGNQASAQQMMMMLDRLEKQPRQ
jgi:transglutaminase-like putative cysteine protease